MIQFFNTQHIQKLYMYIWNPQSKEEFRALATTLRFKNEGQLHDEVSYQGSEQPCLNDIFHDSIAEIFSRNRKGKSVSATLLVEWKDKAKLLLAKNESFHASDEEFRVIVERELREVASKENDRKLKESRGEITLWEAIINHQNKLQVDAQNLRGQLQTLLSSEDIHVQSDVKIYLAKLLESIPTDLTKKLAPAALSPMVIQAYELCLKFPENDFPQVLGDKEKATSLKDIISIIGQPRKSYEAILQKARTNSASFTNLEIFPLPTPQPTLKKGKWDYAKTITFLGKIKNMKTGPFQESKLGGDRKTNIEKFNEFRKPHLKVHAEIQLATYVATHGYLSDPDLKVSDYIGCNKPTCFLCDRFLTKQKRYRTRGCSNHIFNGWMVPDIYCCSKEEADEFRVAVDEIGGELKHEVCSVWE
ncbi:hypothetical protein HYFRA_00001858 [Hymenoscyphus fraxineus]|uniref:Uncharacterized protein n=1 Tax=Hymenoscyphus fraxineus TaxID=746836 RepID=A0A9N9KML3_9HELO|nr:hypothetical protein HYFRA_00001858 [Hymenoscyphus fraxineus]